MECQTQCPEEVIMGELGWPRVVDEVHIKKLEYLDHWLSLPKDRWAKQIGRLSLFTPFAQRPAWWCEIESLLHGYELDLEDRLADNNWARQARLRVKQVAEELWRVNMKSKSSMQVYQLKSKIGLNPFLTGDSNSHLLLKFAVGDMSLDARKQKWDAHNNPLCKLCLRAPETESHMILSCLAYDEERQMFMELIKAEWGDDDLARWQTLTEHAKLAYLLGLRDKQTEAQIRYVKAFLQAIWYKRLKHLEAREKLLM